MASFPVSAVSELSQRPRIPEGLRRDEIPATMKPGIIAEAVDVMSRDNIRDGSDTDTEPPKTHDEPTWKAK